MGQKVHPIGLRIGLYRKWKSNWFLDNTTYSDFLHLNFEINKYFAGILRNSPRKTFFSHCIITKYSLEKIYIFVFFYRLRLKKQKKKKQQNNYKKYNIKKNNELKNNLTKFSNYHILKLIKLFTNNSINLNFITKNYNINFNNNNIEKKSINLTNLDFKIKRGTYKSILTIKNSLKNFLGTNINITFINLLSFTKFYLLKQNNFKLIDGVERQLINFYKYDVKLLRDAINIFFITMITKQPQTLAKFMAYQLRRTPKNRRHGRLIQFYKKLITLILAQQKEILGLQIRFKGRFNGRKRTRSINITSGKLPLQSYNSAIEYGQADAVTIYGAIGIKVWIYYNKNFNNILQKYFIKYFQYSNQKNNNVKT